MKIKLAIGVFIAAIAVLFGLFDVQWAFELALPRDVMTPDPAVESAYQACFAARDHDIHSNAFGTIDNPDVQREFITANRAVAERECRAASPETMITVRQAGRFNLLDLEPRYW